MSIVAMKRALEALDVATTPLREDRITVLEAKDALRAAIEAAERQEPVAEVVGGLRWIGSVPWSKRPTSGYLYATPQPAGEVVVTTDKSGRCVTVTRQDNEGRILNVIWEASPLSQPAIPDGWQLVPVEPTQKMADAGHKAKCCEFWSYRGIYQAMLAAAPEVPK